MDCADAAEFFCISPASITGMLSGTTDEGELVEALIRRHAM